jgi:peptide/nickel transport system ATP-binding protein
VNTIIEKPDVYLSVRNLRIEYTFEGSIVKAVNGISFDLDKGGTLGLVGETGAGKTTTAKSIMRILPVPPAVVRSGQIFFEGVDLLAISEKSMQKYRGQKVTMIFQDPKTSLNPIHRVIDQIAEVIKMHNKISSIEANAKAVDMLKKVGITSDRALEYPHQFSGGMRQRVMIAMALACNPSLLLCDEPTTALDVTVQAQVLNMINDLRKDFGTTMIMISHDLGVIAEMCEKVAVVYAGEIIEYGSKEDLFDNPSHPYTKGLFGALPNMNIHSRRLSPIKGLPPDPSQLPRGCKFNPRCTFAQDSCGEKEINMTEISKGHFCRCILVQEV